MMRGTRRSPIPFEVGFTSAAGILEVPHPVALTPG